MPTFAWDMENTMQPPVLYYDGTVGKDHVHLPYALLALAVLLVFTFLPILLLCVYPCRCFQRVLNRYHLSSQNPPLFHGHFSGKFQKWHKRNQGLPILRSRLFDCASGTLYISRNFHCYFQIFHDKWGSSTFRLATCDLPAL